MTQSLQTLERQAREYRQGTWTPGEVVLRAYDSAIPASQLRGVLSSAAYEGLRDAARLVLSSMPSDERRVGVGVATPEAPMRFTEIPVEFIEFLAAHEPKA